MRAVIFANGDLRHTRDVLPPIHADDLLIAADGGALHMQALNLRPDAAVGDFDSFSAENLEALEAAGVKIFRYPAKKDQTDLELAVQHARDHGASEILVLGALGARWDQTLANLLLPASSAYSDLQIRLVDQEQEITLIRAGQTVNVTGRVGETVSLIPLAGDAGGITTTGLEYPLDKETLRFGSTRGISNVLLDESASVKLETGLLLCVLIHSGK